VQTMPSGKVVGVVAACALVLVLFTALMQSGSSQGDGQEPVALDAAEGAPAVVRLPEDDVDKDFGATFAQQNREQLVLWENGEHASDPLDGAAPMSKADRKRLDKSTKLDKFDESMLQGQRVMDRLEELRQTGEQVKRDAPKAQSDSILVPLPKAASERSKAKPASEWATPLSPTCYVPPGRDTCGPHFIVAGAMKCGTTSMYAYLLDHPQVLPLAPGAKLNGKAILAEKEVRFFNDPTYTQMVTKHGLENALDQYYDLFQPIPPPGSPYFAGHELANTVTGEASPMYICTTFAAQRARGAMPYGKVIIMLRNPIDRSYSEFWFRQALSKRSDVASSKVAKTPPALQIDDVYDSAFHTCVLSEMMVAETCNHVAIADNPTMEAVDEFNSCWQSEMGKVRSDLREGTDFCTLHAGDPVCDVQYRKFCTGNNIKNSLYAHQMIEWAEVFPESQILFLKSEDFYTNTADVMRQVEEFLGLDLSLGFDWHAVTAKAFNIVNPGTRSAEGRDIVAGSSGLRVGASDHEAVSEYPPMSDATRRKLEQFFRPHNEALRRVLGPRSPTW